jgi:hypothetical protein
VWLYSYRKASEDARGGCGRAARSEPGSSGGESKKGEDGGKADPLEEAGNLVGKDSGRCRLSNKLLRARAIEVDDEYAVENNGGRDVGAGT